MSRKFFLLVKELNCPSPYLSVVIIHTQSDEIQHSGYVNKFF